MDDEERERRRDVIHKAYAALDEAREFDAQLDAHIASRDPFAPDPMEEWERLRARSREPEPKPQPRWPALDTARGQSERDEYVDRRADARIANAFGMGEDSLRSLTQGPLLADVIASVIAHERKAMHKHVRASLKEVKRQLAEAKAEIKESSAK